MTVIYLASALFVTLSLVKADYSCWCSYSPIPIPVHKQPLNSSTMIGRLDTFDCTPAYRYCYNCIWVSIQYAKEIGYVKISDQLKLQSCPGSPTLMDAVTTKPVSPFDMTTTTPQTPSTTTRRLHECLCNYHKNAIPVHPAPTNSSGVLGFFYRSNCHPTYHFTSTGANWQSIQYKNKIGYVKISDQLKLQSCPGSPTLMDAVTTKPVSPFDMTTTTPQTPSTTTRRLHECLCNYHKNAIPVHPAPTNSSGVLGFFYRSNCHPTYHFTSTGANWQSIQYKNKIGYVKISDQLKLQSCPGSPTLMDAVTTKPVSPFDMTTTTPQTPSTTTRRLHECLCNYHKNAIPVHPAPTNSSGVLGFFYRSNCHPTYHFTSTGANWQSIQYKNKIGYVKISDQLKLQSCPGSPTLMDAVTTKPVSPFDMTTTTPQTPSTTTRRLHECLCNYHKNAIPVHPAPTNSSGVLGFFYRSNCHPTYHFTSTGANWQSIQYKNKVGYVLLDADIRFRPCLGKVPDVDLVPTPGTKLKTSAATKMGVTMSSLSPSASRLPLVSRSRQTARFTTAKRTVTSSSATSTAVTISSISPSTSRLALVSRSRQTARFSTAKLAEVSSSTTSTEQYGSTATPPTHHGSSQVNAGHNSSIHQSPNKDINKTMVNDTGVDKGTVAGVVLVGFLVGLLCGAVAVLGFIKLRAKSTEKYVVFNNSSTDQEAIVHVN